MNTSSYLESLFSLRSKVAVVIGGTGDELIVAGG
jgi:hypothetical protein